MLRAGTPLKPCLDLIVDLSLARLRELPPQLLPQHRFPELEESQSGPEAFSHQILSRRHESILPEEEQDGGPYHWE